MHWIVERHNFRLHMLPQNVPQNYPKNSLGHVNAKGELRRGRGRTAAKNDDLQYSNERSLVSASCKAVLSFPLISPHFPSLPTHTPPQALLHAHVHLPHFSKLSTTHLAACDTSDSNVRCATSSACLSPPPPTGSCPYSGL